VTYRGTGRDTRWLVVHHPIRSPRLRLFCIPYAGAGAGIYRNWTPHLPPGVELLAIQLPARGARFGEPVVTALDELVRQIHAAIAPELSCPCVFFGHSIGALIAFELARSLQRTRSEQLQHLIISGRRAPHLPRLGPSIHDLPRPEFIALLQAYGGTPPQIMQDADLLTAVIPALRMDFGLSDRYRFRHEAKLRCNLTLLGGTSDSLVSTADLYPWSWHVDGTTSTHLLDAGHFFIHTRANDVIDVVVTVLERVLIRP
jgi:medium-chain acyl-[acyl-carrier-protein] hydrolase